METGLNLYAFITAVVSMEGLRGGYGTCHARPGFARQRAIQYRLSPTLSQRSTASVARPHQGGSVRTDILAPGILLDGNGAITPVGTCLNSGSPTVIQPIFRVTSVSPSSQLYSPAAGCCCRLQFEFQRMIRM